ncbi:MAG: hypothetical protein ACN4G0_19645 [Polyangiales bacterium]
MRNGILFLATLIAALTALAPVSLAQEQIDAVTQINGETLPSDASKVYFNAANCADPASTTYELTLTNAASVTQAYLWAGTQQAGCELNEKRTDQQLLCREMANSTPSQVGDNATILSLSLQDLVNTEIVDCENTALAGQPYWIYAFRNDNPGGTDVTTDGYGIAEIYVDVTPPQPLSITSGLDQDGTQFEITWSSPADSNEIQLYRLWRQDPGASAPVDTELTEAGTKTSWTINASTLNLGVGESTSLFVTAVDMAAVTAGNGNEGDVSEATATVVTFSETLGFCDDPNVDCSGCSVSPWALANGRSSSRIWVIGLLFATVLVWRRRR